MAGGEGEIKKGWTGARVYAIVYMCKVLIFEMLKLGG